MPATKLNVETIVHKKAMTIILILPGLIIITVIIGKVVSSIQFSNEVKTFFSQSENISSRKFSHSQLDDLPEPVQRYFKHVIKNGQPYISYVRLRHDGQLKTDPKKDWVNIKGEQYFTTEKRDLYGKVLL